MSKVIGIDPGKNIGIAVFKGGKLERLETLSFWGAIHVIYRNPDTVFVVELPATTHVWHKGAKARGAIEKTGFNVGKCYAQAELIIEYLGNHGRQTIIEKPAGKINADQFKMLTGWTGQSNAHTRDAAMLAYKYRNIKL